MTPALARIAFCAALVSASAAPGIAAGAPVAAACAYSFDAASALAMAGDGPVVFAASHVIEAFDDGVSGDSKPGLRLCHDRTGITGGAVWVNGSTATLYVSESRRIDRLSQPAPGARLSAAEAIVPPLGANDRIEAIATNTGGQIEAAVSTNGDATKPAFYLFDASATGAAKPVRTFTSSAITAPVSAIAFDPRGELYAYDDNGEILEFHANASGIDPDVVRTIAGPRSMLRPALVEDHGPRPMAIDRVGRIIAGDDRTVVTFATSATGDAVPDEVLTNPQFERLDGIGTDSHGFLYLLGVHRDDNGLRTTGVWIYASLIDRSTGGSAADPIKLDKLAK